MENNITIKTDYDDILVFTHNDMDGVTAGFILKYFFDNNMENPAWDRNVQVYCCDYTSEYNLDFFKQKTIEFINDKKERYKNDNPSIVVYMVDYAIQPNELMPKFNNWLKLNYGAKFYWVDHHITAIQNLLHFNIPGKQSTEHCGAYNLWEFLNETRNEKIEAPKYLKMVNEFDLFVHNGEFSYDNELVPLSNYINSLGLTLNDNECDLIKMLNIFFNNDDETLTKCISLLGKQINRYIIEGYKKNLNKMYHARWMNYECLVINTVDVTSKSFEMHPDYDKVDLMIRWMYDGKVYEYYIYSNKSNIHVGDLCEKYLNGGGHPGCGGGHSDKLIF